MSSRTEKDVTRALVGPDKASSVTTGGRLLPQTTVLYPCSSFSQILGSLAADLGWAVSTCVHGHTHLGGSGWRKEAEMLLSKLCCH